MTVNKQVSESFLRGLAGGVPLVELGTTTRKCKGEDVGKKQFRIILTQGLNRQIRRMCEYFGYRVEKLERLRIMNIEHGDLKPGECRPVTKEELAVLKKSLEKSYSAPRTSASKRRPHSQDKKRVYVAGERHGRTK